MQEDRFEVYINSLEKKLPDYLASLEKEALQNQVPIIRKQTQCLLRFLLASRRPKKILEVGTAVGFSALFMKEYMPTGATITTIEKVEMRLLEARKNLQQMDLEQRITLLEGDAAQVLQQLAEQGESYDFIFMDAAKGQYLNFFEAIEKLLSQDGILISDNILQEGELLESRYSVIRRDRTIHTRMREYVYMLTHREDMETVVLTSGDGVTLTVWK